MAGERQFENKPGIFDPLNFLVLLITKTKQTFKPHQSWMVKELE